MTWWSTWTSYSPRRERDGLQIDDFTYLMKRGYASQQFEKMKVVNVK